MGRFSIRCSQTSNCTSRTAATSPADTALVAVDGAVRARPLELLRIELHAVFGYGLAILAAPGKNEERAPAREIEVTRLDLRRRTFRRVVDAREIHRLAHRKLRTFSEGNNRHGRSHGGEG